MKSFGSDISTFLKFDLDHGAHCNRAPRLLQQFFDCFFDCFRDVLKRENIAKIIGHHKHFLFNKAFNPFQPGEKPFAETGDYGS